MPAAGDQQSGATAKDVALVLARIPIVGPYIDLLSKLSSSGRRWIIGWLVALIAYPLLSFFIVILILRISPASVQRSARELILSSIGVGDVTEKEINSSNKLIDAEIPLSFSQGGGDVYFQAVSTTQNILFEGILRPFPVSDQPANCANVSFDPNLEVGTLEVVSINSSYQGHYPIRAFTEQVQRIKSIDHREWGNFLAGNASGGDDFPLRISFKPNPALKDNPYFKCNQMRLWVNMTIFKPILGEKP